MNYNYIQNFNDIYNYLNNEFDNNSSNNLYKFYKSKELSEKTTYLNKVFKHLEETNSPTDLIKINFNNPTFELKDYTFLSFLNDDYFLCYNNLFKKLYICYYFQNEIGYYSSIDINKYLSNSTYISISPYSNKIFLVFSKSNIIYIINYDLNLKENQLSLFWTIELYCCSYCTEIKKGFFLAITNDNLILYENLNKKMIIENSNHFEKIFPVNNEYFIGYKTNNNSESYLYFYNVEDIKIFKKIKCISDIHIIFKLNEDYIIGFSKKYISFIFIKTKEIVQIIDFSN